MKVQGTTNTGTEVQTTTERTDQELSDALVSAFSAAESDAKRFIFSTGALATAIMDIHEAKVWQRTIDGETGALYTSARAYYTSIGSRFPVLHRLMRDELVTELYSGDYGQMIGVRELAALVHCDPAQVTRSAKRAKAEIEAKAKAEAEAAATEAAAAAAAEAAAEAAANGATEAEAEAAAAAVLRFATAKAEAEAKAATEAAAEAGAEAEAKAAAKAISRAKSQLETALKMVADVRPDMSAEDRAWTLKLVTEAVAQFGAFDALSTGTAPAPAKAKAAPAPASEFAGVKPNAVKSPARKPGPLKGAPVDPTGLAS